MLLELKEPDINVKSFLKYVKESRVSMVPTETRRLALEFLAVSNALGGEVGELQNVVKKIIRKNLFYKDSDLHDQFVLEAGDALHYLLSLIDLAGYSVEHVMAANVQKLDARKQAQLEEVQGTVLSSLATEP